MRRWAGAAWGCWVVTAALSACGQSSETKRLDPSDGSLTEIRERSVDKLDLLLTVDNSRSMKDKQELLAQALPYLLQRLTAPRCVRDCNPSDNCTAAQEEDGLPVGGNATTDGDCVTGLPDMPSLQDLHVGVISSSLGSHGAVGAKDLCVTASDNDHAELLGTLRNVSGTFRNFGFLAWDVSSRRMVGADSDPAVFADKTQQLVRSAGNQGCELEATLEAWYRFLIDPEPPLTVVLNADVAAASGVDQTLLEQRAAFLRPDSAVVIGLLSDENDCSVVDEGYGWLVARQEPMLAGTSQCDVNPNDPCCSPCTTVASPGCPNPLLDVNCQNPDHAVSEGLDAPGVRCWNQKQRFGIDLLYPIERYQKGLSQPVVPDREGRLVQNPLYLGAQGKEPRDRFTVHLMTIVGVPWQDIADEESVVGDGLRYLSTEELDSNGRWDLLLGGEARPPADPFMLESIDERSGDNPITANPIAPSGSASQANRINGHEHANIGNDELQYACTFPLAAPRDCTTDADPASCDCTEADAKKNSPLCQPPEGGPTGTTQYFAKAYPGTRFLKLIKVSANQVSTSVASVCPKDLDETKPSYGYLPAVDGMLREVRHMFAAACFPRPLPVRADGTLDGCGVLTASPGLAGCDCAAQGGSGVSEALADKVRDSMQRQLTCDVDDTPACSSLCVCQVPELSGADLLACQTSSTPPNAIGFCYISAQPGEPNVGNPKLVSNCSDDQRRHLRFVGDAVPAASHTFLNCDKPFYSIGME